MQFAPVCLEAGEEGMRRTPGQIRRENHNSKRYMHPTVHCNTIYNSQHVEAT